MEVVELARDSLNPELSLLGVLLNLADMRTVHSREALVSLKERFGEEVVFDTVVRASIAYAESAERATSILDHRPDLGADYVAVAGEVLARLPGFSRPTSGSPGWFRARPRRPSARSRLAPSELSHVGALRLERAPAAASPSPRSLARSASATAPVCS